MADETIIRLARKAIGNKQEREALVIRFLELLDKMSTESLKTEIKYYEEALADEEELPDDIITLPEYIYICDPSYLEFRDVPNLQQSFEDLSIKLKVKPGNWHFAKVENGKSLLDDDERDLITYYFEHESATKRRNYDHEKRLHVDSGEMAISDLRANVGFSMIDFGRDNIDLYIHRENGVVTAFVLQEE